MKTVQGEVIRRQTYGAAPTGVAPQMSGAAKAYLEAKMKATVTAMRAGFMLAQRKVDLTPNSVVGSLLAVVTGGLTAVGMTSASTVTKQNVKNGLTTLARGFEQRIPTAIPRVLSGELEADRWFAMTQPYVEGIQNILNVLNENSTSAQLGASFMDTVNDVQQMLGTLAKTAAELGEAARRGAKSTFENLPVILTLLGVVAVLSLVGQLTAPVKALSGYGGRRRRRQSRLSA